MKNLKLIIIAGLVGAIFAAPRLVELEVFPTEPAVVEVAEAQVVIFEDESDEEDDETFNPLDVMAGMPTDKESLNKAFERLKESLPPSAHGLLDKQLSGIGGVDNLQQFISDKLEKYGGFDKIQEALKQKIGKMGNVANMMGQNNGLNAQIVRPPTYQQVPALQAPKINLTDKDSLKRAVDEMKRKMPPTVQQILEIHIGDFDGSLPDLSHMGIEKFPTTKEEITLAIKTIKEQLPEETKNMLTKLNTIQSMVSGSWKMGARDL